VASGAGVGGRGVVLERLVMRDVVILVAVVVGTGGRPADPAERDANRVHCIAETLVGRGFFPSYDHAADRGDEEAGCPDNTAARQ
jgi:hypothetical protein